MTGPSFDRFQPPRAETPSDAACNQAIGAEQRIERLRSRLESSLEVALAGLRERDYLGVASELEGVEGVAAQLAESDES